MRPIDLWRLTGEEGLEDAFARAAMAELQSVPAERWRRLDPAPFALGQTVAFELSGQGYPKAVLSLRRLGASGRRGREAVELVLSTYGVQWRAAGRASLSRR